MKKRRIGERDPYFRKLSSAWSQAIRDAFLHIDEYEEEDAEPETNGAPADSEVDDPLPRPATAQATAGWINEVDS